MLLCRSIFLFLQNILSAYITHVRETLYVRWRCVITWPDTCLIPEKLNKQFSDANVLNSGITPHKYLLLLALLITGVIVYVPKGIICIICGLKLYLIIIINIYCCDLKWSFTELYVAVIQFDIIYTKRSFVLEKREHGRRNTS